VRPDEQGIAQSVRQRLLNLSADSGEEYNRLLMRFAVERLQANLNTPIRSS